jgi:hypothetical protein
MTRLIVLLSAVAFYAPLYGCDGLTIRRATIDLGQNRPATSAATVRPIDLQEFLQLMENVAVNNGMKCNVYNETEKYFGCGVGSFGLLVNVKEDRVVPVEVREFGPWGKTKRFEKLEGEIDESLARKFPGRNLALRPER